MDVSQLNTFHVRNLAVDLKKMPLGILQHEYLLIATCEKKHFMYAVPLQNRKTHTIADVLLHVFSFLQAHPLNYQ